MNIRKNIDYSEMYAELDKAMAADIPQMELYCEIGKAVCRRTEKAGGVRRTVSAALWCTI